MSHRESLILLERLYDLCLQVEQLRRDQPNIDDDPEAFGHWQGTYNSSVDKIWEEMQVMVPLETRYAPQRLA